MIDKIGEVLIQQFKTIVAIIATQRTSQAQDAVPAMKEVRIQHLARDEVFKGKRDIVLEEWMMMILALLLTATTSFSSVKIKITTLTTKKTRWTWTPTWEASQRETQCQLEAAETVIYRIAREVLKEKRMMATQTRKRSS